jgi:hypothetical protein
MMKDLFDIFRTREAVEVEDLADYQVILLDTEQPTQAAMAITALTLYQLEHGYDRGRFQMLLWAMSKHCANVVRARAIVGLLLVCARLNVTDEWALEQMAELLSFESELAFDAWVAILQTGKPKVYDPNLEMVKPIYGMQPFTKAPELFFEPFEREQLGEMDEFEWRLADMFFETMNVCDSDKYALLVILKQYLPVIVEQLREQEIDLEQLEYVDINFQKMMMISNGKNQLQRRDAELTEVENYVQQLYRYIRLSRHTPLRLTENLSELRNTMIDRMVVVGKEKRDEIENI